MTSQTADRRTRLHAVYMFVVENWAVDTADVKAKFEGAPSLLKTLKTKGLLVSNHVNEDKALTWQSMFDAENDADAEAKAEQAFNEAFPAKAEAAPAKRKGATGDRYTPEQIKAGLAARKAGKSRKEVATAAGVKSPNYFAGVLAKIEAEQAAKPKRAKKAAVDADAQRRRAAKAVAKAVNGPFSGAAVLAAAQRAGR